MFTGIIESVGEVMEVLETPGGRRFWIRIGRLDDPPQVGSSVAISGVCLTVVETADDSVALEAVPETLRRTTLGTLVAGHTVNLERAMEAGGRFEGHLVQGHVDGVGEVVSVTEEGGGRRISLSIPNALTRYAVEKGSLAVDGVSLTIAALDRNIVELAIIPHTLKVTTLGLRRPGDQVNLEVDVIAKYVARLLEAWP